MKARLRVPNHISLGLWQKIAAGFTNTSVLRPKNIVFATIPVERRADRNRVAGFTIVETLIVLAVTGLLFVSAAFLISGKQNSTQFNQGVRDVQTQLLAVMGEVSSGAYPNMGNLKCEKVGSSPRLTAGTSEQGTNKDCIFMGKALQFAVDTATDPEPYNIYTIAALRGDSAAPTTDLASAQPRLVASATGEPDVPDFFETKNLPYGMTVAKMYYDGDPSKAVAAIGFVSSIGQLGAKDASQQVNVAAIPGTVLHRAKLQAVKDINDNLPGSVVNPAGGVQICLRSGGTNQSVLYSIGGAGRQLSVEVAVKNSVDCS